MTGRGRVMDRQDVQKMGMRLLKKGHIGLVRLVFSRIGLLALLLLLQVALVLTAFILCGQYIPHLIILQGVFVVVMVIFLINSDFDPSAKITWLFAAVITLASRQLSILRISSRLIPANKAHFPIISIYFFINFSNFVVFTTYFVP